MSFTLKLEGLEDTIDRLKTMNNEVANDVDKEIGAGIEEMAKIAKMRAPVDNGTLKNGIVGFKEHFLQWKLQSRAPYSAYVNWGTITRVKVEKGWEGLAILFKGKGIKKTGGLYPTFFFTGVVDAYKSRLIENIKKIINK